ncbi:hypothetical protein, partial [Neisseria sp. P0017.S004]|uniref:hypothetical protein n=1 Tax=Neisseria sp. P0017.S004 TaxID=3436780 RepID=UPI003F80C3F1
LREAAKRKKGYRDMAIAEGEMTPEVTRAQAVLARLERGLRGEEGGKLWPLNRVIWRAGELKLRSAIPLLIQLLRQIP